MEIRHRRHDSFHAQVTSLETSPTAEGGRHYDMDVSVFAVPLARDDCTPGEYARVGNLGYLTNLPGKAD